tara:strand:+ start:359 stop:586 length:228 start_codon:yes stop_codon:yes gene_type:complete
MENPFTKHPRESVNEGWLEHYVFTLKVANYSFLVAIIFILHGLFPFLKIPKFLNLEAFKEWLDKANIDRECKKNK